MFFKLPGELAILKGNYNSLATHAVAPLFTTGVIAYWLDTGGTGVGGFKHYPIPGERESESALTDRENNS